MALDWRQSSLELNLPGFASNIFYDCLVQLNEHQDGQAGADAHSFARQVAGGTSIVATGLRVITVDKQETLNLFQHLRGGGPDCLVRLTSERDWCELDATLGETGFLVVQGPTVVDLDEATPVSAEVFYGYQDKEMLLLPVRSSATGDQGPGATFLGYVVPRGVLERALTWWTKRIICFFLDIDETLAAAYDMKKLWEYFLDAKERRLVAKDEVKKAKGSAAEADANKRVELAKAQEDMAGHWHQRLKDFARNIDNLAADEQKRLVQCDDSCGFQGCRLQGYKHQHRAPVQGMPVVMVERDTEHPNSSSTLIFSRPLDVLVEYLASGNGAAAHDHQRKRFDVVVVTHASPERAKICLLAVDTKGVIYPDDAATQREKLVCVPQNQDKNAVQALAGTVASSPKLRDRARLSNEQQAQKQQHMAMPLVLIWDNSCQAWALPYKPCIIECVGFTGFYEACVLDAGQGGVTQRDWDRAKHSMREGSRFVDRSKYLVLVGDADRQEQCGRVQHFLANTSAFVGDVRQTAAALGVPGSIASRLPLFVTWRTQLIAQQQREREQREREQQQREREQQQQRQLLTASATAPVANSSIGSGPTNLQPAGGSSSQQAPAGQNLAAAAAASPAPAAAPKGEPHLSSTRDLLPAGPGYTRPAGSNRGSTPGSSGNHNLPQQQQQQQPDGSAGGTAHLQGSGQQRASHSSALPAAPQAVSAANGYQAGSVQHVSTPEEQWQQQRRQQQQGPVAADPASTAGLHAQYSRSSSSSRQGPSPAVGGTVLPPAATGSLAAGASLTRSSPTSAAAPAPPSPGKLAAAERRPEAAAGSSSKRQNASAGGAQQLQQQQHLKQSAGVVIGSSGSNGSTSMRFKAAAAAAAGEFAAVAAPSRHQTSADRKTQQQQHALAERKQPKRPQQHMDGETVWRNQQQQQSTGGRQQQVQPVEGPLGGRGPTAAQGASAAGSSKAVLGSLADQDPQQQLQQLGARFVTLRQDQVPPDVAKGAQKCNYTCRFVSVELDKGSLAVGFGRDQAAATADATRRAVAALQKAQHAAQAPEQQAGRSAGLLAPQAGCSKSP